MKNALLYGVVLLSLGASSPASAALQIFTDRSAWHAAAVGTTELSQDFNSYTTDVFYGAVPVTAGFLTLSVVNGRSDASWLIDAVPAEFGTIPDVNGSTFATTLVNSPAGFGGTQLAFAPVRALGFDYAGASYSLSDGILTTSLGDSITVAKSGNDNRAFVGVIYTAGETFTSLTWSSGAFAAGIDNVSAFQPVPEPTTALMLCLGIAHAARAAIHEDDLTWFEVRVEEQSHVSRQSDERPRRRFGIRHPSRCRVKPTLIDRGILGERPLPTEQSLIAPPYAIARLEPLDLGPHLIHRSRQITAKDVRKAVDHRDRAGTDVRVDRIDRDRSDFDEDFIGTRLRDRLFAKLDDRRRTGLADKGSFHGHGFPWGVGVGNFGLEIRRRLPTRTGLYRPRVGVGIDQHNWTLIVSDPHSPSSHADQLLNLNPFAIRHTTASMGETVREGSSIGTPQNSQTSLKPYRVRLGQINRRCEVCQSNGGRPREESPAVRLPINFVSHTRRHASRSTP